ncbi:MAG: hypothetical protein ACYDAE_23155 [Steroidobacteraceae bacterium]
MTLLLTMNLGFAWGTSSAPASDRRIYWQWNQALVQRYYRLTADLLLP